MDHPPPQTRLRLPTLPNEVHLELAGHLDGRTDSQLLRNLSLVNTFWRRESQKILFRDVGRWDHAAGVKVPESIRRHSDFLRSVINAPERLGPYVFAYAQQLRASHYLLSNIDAVLSKSMEKVRKQTQKAVPLMINLRRLSLWSLSAKPYLSLLRDCTCQLRSLQITWDCVAENKENLTAFLLTQHELRHLSIQIDDVEIIGLLPPEACPKLVSFATDTLDVGDISDRTSIVAFDASLVEDINHFEAAPAIASFLQRLKYLKIEWTLLWREFPGQVLSNIVVLDIDLWIVQHEPQLESHLANFPGLKVLAFREDTEEMNDEDPEEREEDIKFYFQHCPRLERIILHNVEFTSYTTFTLTRPEGSDWSAVEVHATVAHHGYTYNDPWWAVYEVMEVPM